MSKQSCLMVLSAAIEGVSAQGFIQAFTLAQSTYNIQLASPGGKPVEYIQQDDTTRRWLNDFRTKAYSLPISLESVDPHRYAAVLVPHSPGAVNDLAHNTDLGHLLEHFQQQRKPVCAVGMGVAALACAGIASHSTGASDPAVWSFSNYSLTATSVRELVTTPYFSNVSLVPEDFIKDQGAQYSCSEPAAVHIVVDRHLVTGQNEQSTLIAVQNLILLSNQRSGKLGPSKSSS